MINKNINNICEHITSCQKCEGLICSYCVEDCSGCQLEACKDCYDKHLISCQQCQIKLCKSEMLGNICPTCDMKNESKL